MPYGATLTVEDGAKVKAGQPLANWDPLTRPIITEYAGEIRFENVEEGVTVAKQIDETTGLSSLVVIDPKRRGTSATKGLRPAVKLIGDKGKEVKLATGDTPVNYTFQIGAIITVKNGQQVNVGDVLARIPQESSKTRDITGGLPRVAELFEARSPKDAGLLAEVTGTVSFGKDTKGKQRLIITDFDGAGARVPDPEGQARHRARRPGGQQGRDDRRRPGRSARHPAAARGWRRSRATSSTRSRTSTASRA